MSSNKADATEVEFKAGSRKLVMQVPATMSATKHS